MTTSNEQAIQELDKAFEKVELSPKFKINDNVLYDFRETRFVFTVNRIEINQNRVTLNGMNQDYCKKIKYEVIDE
jgi:hypothetical protein